MKRTLTVLILFLVFSIPCLNSPKSKGIGEEEKEKIFVWYLKQKYPPNDWSWVKSYQSKMKDMYNLK